MSPTILADGLKSMTPTDSEQSAIDALAAAWENYFYQAMAGPIPATPGSLAGATSAMKSSLIGMSQTGQGAAKITAGIVSFWGQVAAMATSIFPGATSATPPPSLAAIAASVSAAFAANVAAKANLDASAIAVAGAVHPNNLGGIAIFPPPPTGIGPQPIA